MKFILGQDSEALFGYDFKFNQNADIYIYMSNVFQSNLHL